MKLAAEYLAPSAASAWPRHRRRRDRRGNGRQKNGRASAAASSISASFDRISAAARAAGNTAPRRLGPEISAGRAELIVGVGDAVIARLPVHNK